MKIEKTNIEAHDAEIINSRRGGFGGSDAALFLKVGRAGSADVLSATDLHRVAVAMGQAENIPFAGNVYTKAGHYYEEYVEAQHFTFSDDVMREPLISEHKTDAFETFAHADFYDEREGRVFECKFTQGTAEEAAIKYAAQLNWYYFLGAKHVTLCHGKGDVFPFDVTGETWAEIEPSEEIIEALGRGVEIMADFVQTFVYAPAEVVDVADGGDEYLQAAAMRYAELKAKAEQAAKEAEEAREELAAQMRAAGLSTICNTGEGLRFTATLSKDTTTRTFDAKAAAKDYPDILADKYYKTASRKGSLTIKFAK